MKKISVVVLMVATIFSCSKKATPTKTETSSVNKEATVSAPAVVDTPATVAMPSEEQLAAGKNTYARKCVTCHALHAPEEYTAVRWVGIVGWMAPKAKLSDEEKKNVLAYVQTNAKK